MTKQFRIRFTATFFPYWHSVPHQDDVPTSLVVVAILLLVLLLFCRMVSSFLHFCRLRRLARCFDTAFVTSEIVINKLNPNLIAKPPEAFRRSLVRSGQVDEANVFHSGGRHKHQESFTSTASIATTETMDSSKTAYADSPKRMQDFEIAEEDNTTSASDIMNDKDRWMIDCNTHNSQKDTPSQNSLPSPPSNTPLTDPFSLTTSQRADSIERARRDSQRDGSCCNNRNHTRRQCCSPTPVGDLMEKAEKTLGDNARPYEPMKVPRSPHKVGVGSGDIPSNEDRPSGDSVSATRRQMQNSNFSYPRILSVTPDTKFGSMAGVLGDALDGCEDLRTTLHTAADSHRSPGENTKDGKYARESPHLGAWRIDTPDQSSSLGGVILHPLVFDEECLGSPKRPNPQRGSPPRQEVLKARPGSEWSDHQASASDVPDERWKRFNEIG